MVFSLKESFNLSIKRGGGVTLSFIGEETLLPETHDMKYNFIYFRSFYRVLLLFSQSCEGIKLAADSLLPGIYQERSVSLKRQIP